MKKINNCTLVCVDCFNYGLAIKALRKSMEQNEFDAVKLFTDIGIKQDSIETVIIKKINSVKGYSYFIMKELYKYIDTDYVLIVQHDGYTLNGNLFDERLYDYDYAGALWLNEGGYENGNGGYSWRSKKLLDAVALDPFIVSTSPEDLQICKTYRDYLENKYGLKWATDEICEGFSYELRQPIKKTMGFHGYYHAPFKPIVVIKRMAAGGDVLQVEPILKYFYDKGYRVVLDTLPQFYDYFRYHYFPVEFFEHLDKRLPYEFYNLDMSYESNPTKKRIRTYYEFCGIKDAVNFMPKLNFPVSNEEKIIKEKYVFIHNEKKNNERSVFGVDWGAITSLIKKNGYIPVQFGLGNYEEIKGALHLRSLNANQLMYAIGGCEFFIGIDSMPSHIALALGKRAIIFFGNVDANIVHEGLDHIEVIDNGIVCDTPKCWHRTIGCEGLQCVVDKELPPCTNFKTANVCIAIYKTIDKINNETNI